MAQREHQGVRGVILAERMAVPLQLFIWPQQWRNAMTNPNMLPGFGQSQMAAEPPRAPTPSTPTPEDPREHEPIHDPPIDPEHDADESEVRQADAVGAADLAADAGVFDEPAE
jgi:hypothetical protein